MKLKKLHLLLCFILIFSALLPLLWGCGTSRPSSYGSSQASLLTPPPPPLKAQPINAKGPKVANPKANSGRFSIQVSLNQGWNTIAFPLKSVSSATGFTYHLYKYNGSSYDEINPVANPGSIDCRYGYWTYADSAFLVTVEGEENLDPGKIMQVALSTGWNFLGLPYGTPKTFSELQVSYNAETKSLAQASTVDIPAPGGKWLYARMYDYTHNLWNQQLTTDINGQMLSSRGYWLWSWVDGTLFYEVPPSWKWENQLPQGNALSRIWGTSSSNLYTVGDTGVILHYNGSTWDIMNSGTTSWMWGLWGTSASDIYAVGRGGTILHYDGSNWSSMTSGTTNDLRSVWGTSAADIFAVGSSGLILHYNGSAWSAMNSGVSNYFYDVWGTASNNVFAVGSSGKILRYNGSTWANSPSTTTKTITSIWGTSAADIFAVGSQGIALHYNGSTWSAYPQLTVYDLYSLWGTSGTDVYAAGSYPSLGLCYHFNGTNWSYVNLGLGSSSSIPFFWNIWGLSGNEMYAVGGGGFIAKYNGTSWAKMTGEVTFNMQSIWGASANDIYIGGIGIAHYNGTTWSNMDYTGYSVSDLWGTSPTNVYGVDTYGQIWRCNGTSWAKETLDNSQSLYGIWGSSDTDIFAVGGNGTIVHNAGGFWEFMNPGTSYYFYDVWGSSPENVYAVGDSGSVFHYNGNYWEALNIGTSYRLKAIWGASPNAIWTGGFMGNSIRYFNGTAWSSQSTGIASNANILGIWGTSASDVFAVGEWGALSHYNGTTWSPVNFPNTNSLSAVWGTAANNVYAVGEWGTILHLH